MSKLTSRTGSGRPRAGSPSLSPATASPWWRSFPPESWSSSSVSVPLGPRRDSPAWLVGGKTRKSSPIVPLRSDGAARELSPIWDEEMAFLFDTDAISELYRKRPSPRYLSWLGTVPRAEQFTSAVSLGELFRGAYRSTNTGKHLANIENLVLPTITVLPYDVAIARIFGQISAELAGAGKTLMDADLQI